ncbi:hypothetical protein DL96DRAFT_1760086 [Flagelloscypha sp. PMI_526]|nr:hypothetical protein DL96DRAFT_1760086 [Flagelloscypha sp. PMI_526]
MLFFLPLLLLALRESVHANHCDNGGVAQYANTSMIAHGGMASFDMGLVSRQTFQCEIPGGPQCSATTCCAPGDQCCPGGCCGLDETCQPGQCCPKSAKNCGGNICCETGAVCCSKSITGCCEPGGTCCSGSISGCCPAGMKCCRGGCCRASEECEIDTCLSTSLSTRVIRFKYNEKKNGAVLRNMCNGMRGKNTQTFTYSGKLSKSSKRQKRRAAGCKSGKCSKLGVPGMNSCDEWPPASTDEGGNATAENERAVTCIPGTQNSYQGGIFSGLLSTLTKGDQFVISIDCDEVLGSIVPRQDIQSSGGITSNETFPGGLLFINETSPYVIVPLGDLDSGSYTVTTTVVSGFALNATVVSNEGDVLNSTTANITAGQSTSLFFDLPADMFGIGVLMAVQNEKTNVTWSITGTTHPPSEEEEEDPTATAQGSQQTSVGSNGSVGGVQGLNSFWIAITVLSNIITGI